MSLQSNWQDLCGCVEKEKRRLSWPPQVTAALPLLTGRFNKPFQFLKCIPSPKINNGTFLYIFFGCMNTFVQRLWRKGIKSFYFLFLFFVKAGLYCYQTLLELRNANLLPNVLRFFFSFMSLIQLCDQPKNHSSVTFLPSLIDHTKVSRATKLKKLIKTINFVIPSHVSALLLLIIVL